MTEEALVIKGKFENGLPESLEVKLDGKKNWKLLDVNEILLGYFHKFIPQQENFYIKRFTIEKPAVGKSFYFINEAKGSSLIVVSTETCPVVEMEYLKGKGKQKFSEQIDLSGLIEVKGWKARGKRLSNYRVTYVELIESDEPEIIIAENTESKEAPAEQADIEKEDTSKENDQMDLFD